MYFKQILGFDGFLTPIFSVQSAELAYYICHQFLNVNIGSFIRLNFLNWNFLEAKFTLFKLTKNNIPWFFWSLIYERESFSFSTGSWKLFALQGIFNEPAVHTVNYCEEYEIRARFKFTVFKRIIVQVPFSGRSRPESSSGRFR